MLVRIITRDWKRGYSKDDLSEVRGMMPCGEEVDTGNCYALVFTSEETDLDATMLCNLVETCCYAANASLEEELKDCVVSEEGEDWFVTTDKYKCKIVGYADDFCIEIVEGL
tara:strand:+ start:816 stop:1151 length:336 start_codon:yes stop_codon:yes gene_type:complete